MPGAWNAGPEPADPPASLWPRVVAFSREHAIFVGLVAAYFALTALYFLVLGRWEHWTIQAAYPLWALAAIVFSCARLLVARLRGGRGSALWRPEAFAGAVLVLAIVIPFQTTFSSIKRTIDDVWGFPWDPALAQADYLLHGRRHAWEWLRWIVEDRFLIFWIDRAYLWWFPIVTLFLFWAAWTPHRQLRQRALIATVLLWGLCGNISAMAFASAGPCYYDKVAPAPDPYVPLRTLLDLHARSGEYVQARVVQRMLWARNLNDPVAPFRGISAMPSMHVGMAVLIALVAWSRHRAAGVALWLYAAVIMIGSVALAWHYAIDGYVGALMGWGIWRLSRRPAAWATSQ